MALTVVVLLAGFAAFDALAVPLGTDNTTTPATYSNAPISAVASSSQGLPIPITPTTSEPGTAASTSMSAQAVVAPTLPAGPATTFVLSTVTLPASTVTVTGSPQTVTDTITIIPPPTPSSAITSTTTTTTIQPTTWSAPPQMTDLSAFNVQNFASGERNMRIIVSDPPIANVASLPSSPAPPEPDPIGQTLTEAVIAVVSAVTSGLIPPPPPVTSSSFLQLFYPANSINPGQQPAGGADFYAAPLDLSAARNVSLEYSVFFPSDFDWVEAGKLPGMYGGHDGCSGGDDAIDCFSTRLMWRGGGLGELYLYAPKDKQTPALCATPPESVCDADYGLSIGRGSFRFAAGNWTHVKQTVVLNTPGQQDGAFALDVNGVRVIDRHDVFYRDVPGAVSRRDVYSAPAADTETEDEDGRPSVDLAGPDLPAPIKQAVSPPGTSDAEMVYDRDGTAVSPDSLAPRDFAPSFSSVSSLAPWIAGGSSSSSDLPLLPSSPPSPASAAAASTLPGAGAGVAKFAPPSLPPPLSQSLVTVTGTGAVTVVPPPQTVSVTPTSTATAYVVAMESGGPLPVTIGMKATEPVGFIGLFFSTFFGGHEPRYATPKDQFTWFKDFAMSVNG
ncbi:hypothetical protein BD311DRAFT_462777 [Dichomitus squalens]|uniref:Polysaccharide lyase 14 domain-containing protein n=1 Tax=Dichomitus squalens TaxID=114155 RepID=A0A4V2JZR5_9APHY|nr:hypothetical protein BD311DRAFT_462777 [Dichomitus squalens]